MPVTSSIAARNEASFAFEGLLKPVIFLTNCSEAARISSSVTGGSKLKRVLIFLHIDYDLKVSEHSLPRLDQSYLLASRVETYSLLATYE